MYHNLDQQNQQLTDAEVLERQRTIEREKMAYQNSPLLFQSVENQNLVKYQLDVNSELKRIEILLRKQIPKRTPNGKMYYVDPPEEYKVLNERGVNEVMNLLTWYINKNILLSNYAEEVINQRCEQFMNYFSDFLMNNYELFGMNTRDKMKHYPMIVMNVVNTIEAAYNRAWKGQERESLRTARQVHQTEPLAQSQQNIQPAQQNNRSIFKPWTWTK